MEEDLFTIAPELARLSHSEATHRAEQTIRNHDPCISCATHFLTLRLERA
jgi:coenzyme F420-reducing hydrogenase alpha subunit